jgi:hypothetical protein
MPNPSAPIVAFWLSLGYQPLRFAPQRANAYLLNPLKLLSHAQPQSLGYLSWHLISSSIGILAEIREGCQPLDKVGTNAGMSFSTESPKARAKV